MEGWRGRMSWSSFSQRSGNGSGTRSRVRRPPRSQGWPAIAKGESTLILAPTGSGKTLTAFLWCINRLMFEPAPAAGQRLPGAVHLTAQSPRRRHRAQSAGAARRHRQSRGSTRRWLHPAFDRDPHRRHAGDGARPVPARARRHPDHDARIPVSPADLECAGSAALARHGHPRRDSRAGPDQARRAPCPVARAARVPPRRERAAAAANRAVRHPASARRSRAIPRGARSRRSRSASALEEPRAAIFERRSRSECQP